MTSIKSISAPTQAISHIYNTYSHKLQNILSSFTNSWKAATDKSLPYMKLLNLKMPELVYLQKTKNGILLKQEEILKAFSVLAMGLLIVHFTAFKAFGFIQSSAPHNFIAFCPLLLNIALVLFAYKKMHASAMLTITWLLPALMMIVSFRDPSINYSKVIILYAVAILLLNNTASQRLIGFSWLALAFTVIQIRYSAAQMPSAGNRFFLFEMTMLPIFCLVVYLVLSRLKKEFTLYQKEILQQKELLEKKNESLESLISLSEQQREKLKRTVLFKEKLISVISHDIRVPINSFRFLIENYERGYLTDKMVLDGIIETKKDLIKVDNMVVDLVSWSKDEKSTCEKQQVCKKQLYEIIESILAIYTLCAKNKKLTIIPVIDVPDNMCLAISKREIEIILRNLVSNAIKFSNPDNKIIVCIKKKPGTSSAVVLSVRDFGNGMHPSILERLNGGKMISTIGTMNEVGLGVGLSIVFDVINNHSMQYNIDSKEGKGTKFSINMPLVTCTC